MEEFSEEHSKCLLSKEWLIKSDNQTSTPYLFKFYSNEVPLSCCVLLTDTKSVWMEVLTSKQFARRWRNCNHTAPPPFTGTEEEDEWKTTIIELLSRAHTVGGITDIPFELVESNYSDLAFELKYESFKWRWETCFLGHKASAEIISKHLIIPLMSLNHLSFTSPQAISEMLDAEVEKAVDKVGRTARRSIDTYIKNALSKPRLASTLRRMTAMFNFISELPPITSTVEIPDLHVAVTPHSVPISVKLNTINVPPRAQVAETLQNTRPDSPLPVESQKPLIQEDSATEESDDELVNAAIEPSTSGPSSSRPSDVVGSPKPFGRKSPAPRVLPMPPVSKDSDSDSSRPPPAKKLKKPAKSSSSDDDSEEERKRRVEQLKGGAGTSGKRGTKQPIKRGGKRF